MNSIFVLLLGFLGAAKLKVAVSIQGQVQNESKRTVK